MTIRTLEDAIHEMHAMEADALADTAFPDEIEIDARDLVVAVCFEINSDDICRELCRTQLGYVPYELEPRLGKRDWLDS